MIKKYKEEKFKPKVWDKETLKKYADQWLVEKGTYIKLLTIKEFDKVRKGTKLVDRFGKIVKKGHDTNDDVRIFGRMPYGLKLIKQK